MKGQLSILIPTFNDDCSPLVALLSEQARQTAALEYEILVGDDGSTDLSIVGKNRQACEAECCRYVRRERNMGRAATRNFLARNARYDRLLFVDCHVDLPKDFIGKYMSHEGSEAVVCGGVKAGAHPDGEKQNLRYEYERAGETRHDAHARQQRPYQSFRTTNFMIARATLLAHPFDEQFRSYGYEDVLYGKRLEEHGVDIAHISNEVSIGHYESNERYVEKMEEALRTLHQFAPHLRGYSRLLKLADRLESWHLAPIGRRLFRLFRPALRKQLCGNHPSLSLFTAYRLGYFLALSK